MVILIKKKTEYILMPDSVEFRTKKITLHNKKHHYIMIKGT